MPSPLDRAAAALLPLDGLAALAAERCRGDVQVVIDGGHAWVTWPAGTEAVWQAMLAVPGIIFFEQHDGRWHALGRRLPRFDVPLRGEPRCLDALLFPAPVHAEPAPTDVGPAVRLSIVPSERVRPASALRATIAQLLPWVERAPTAELRACRVAACGDRIMLLGEPLPPVPGAERFWGERVLVPLGFRPEPDVPESALRIAANSSLGELLVLTADGAEAIPDSAFAPLTRAVLRKATNGSE
jgi:hypothetical protein